MIITLCCKIYLPKQFLEIKSQKCDVLLTIPLGYEPAGLTVHPPPPE